ncbi:hypothetical protein ACCS55_09105 [Rhizobium ruizarguesonis]
MFNTVDTESDLAAHLSSLAEMKGRGFALATQVLEGETLRETVLRATAHNGFQSTSVAVNLSNARSFKSVSAVSTGFADDIEKLVKVLGIQKDAAAARKALSPCPSSGRDWMNFFGINVRRGHLSGARRVSPRSLQKHGRQKAIWSLKPFSFDPETREKLLSHCPVCQRRLGWDRTYGVTYCDGCSLPGSLRGAVDLREFPQPLIEVCDEEALEFATYLVDPEKQDRSSLVRSLHSDLKDRNRGELFQLAVQLAGFLQRAGCDQDSHLTPTSLALAGRALLGWPEAYDAVVFDAVSNSGYENISNPLPADRSLAPEIRNLLKSRAYIHLRSKIALRQSKPGYPVDHRTLPAPAHRTARCELQRLVKGGASPGEVSVKVLRDAGEGQRLAKLLGLPVPFLVDLYDGRMLPELDAILGNFRTPVPGARIQSLPTLLRKMTVLDCDCEGVGLSELSFVMANMDGERWGKIFRALVDGRLRAWRRAKRGDCGVQSLMINDACALFEVLAERRSDSATRNVPLLQVEVALALGVSRGVVGGLIKGDVLSRNPTWSEIADFRRQWMLSSEIRARLLFERRPTPQRLRALEASVVARLSTENSTVWSRAGTCEYLKLPGRFLA